MLGSREMGCRDGWDQRWIACESASNSAVGLGKYTSISGPVKSCINIFPYLGIATACD